MDDYKFYLNKLFPGDDEYNAENDTVLPVVLFGATDSPVNSLNSLGSSILSSASKKNNGSLAEALDALIEGNDETKLKGWKNMAEGAMLKTVASASDLFTRVVGLASGQEKNIRDAADIAKQNYDNQMEALDNRVLYIKNELSDRFNKTVETNVMNMAARNLRVSGANVLELSKAEARDITEDFRMAESNAEMQKIALRAKKKQASESADYAVKQMWAGLVGSAVKLGFSVETAGGTGESWGDLFAGRRAYYEYKKGPEEFTKALKLY